jgi:uncharacterized protein (TIGR03435 family)
MTSHHPLTVIVASVIITLAAVRLSGSDPEFAVATIKPSDLSTVSPPQQVGPLTFFERGTVRQLICLAYRLEHYQVVGGPPWIDIQRYDVHAKAEAPATRNEICGMLAGLLRNRFQLSSHTASLEMSGYELIVGRGGPKLARGKADTPPDGRGAIQLTESAVVAGNATMGLFAHFLTMELERPVLDNTGLPGGYDFNLTYAPHTVRSGQRDVDSGDDLSAPPGSIFASVKDIGLALQGKELNIPVLVIDNVRRPAEN